MKAIAQEPAELGRPDGLEVYRHSTSHLMAQAVQELYPGVKVAIGPAIESGFYYDFDYRDSFTPEDLGKIEERMREIAARKLPIERLEMSREEAVEFFSKKGEDYKVELLEEIEEETVSVYRQGEWADLCRGPHLPNTSRIKNFKLLKVAGAYWRGDEKNKMLQRIYGAAFPDRKELKAHLKRLEEAEKRDHRRLGKQLDLFSTAEEVGPGLILWHPRGALIRKLIEDFWRDEHYKAGYELLYTPHIARLDLWRTSGHTGFYKENMFSPMEVEGQEYELKPMNCPFHISIYKSRLRSYREMPIRWAELGTVYRYERSGVLHGLMRVRGFTQDDAHIFCRPDQLESEISRVIDFVTFILGVFGFEKFEVFLSTRPEKSVGTDEGWEKSTAALKTALEGRGMPYEVDPGEGVFYGPKIDIKIKDVLDRSWQCSTIQVDFNLPEKFDVEYIGEDGGRHRPIMIHRALMGSLERFFGVLIEHYNGAFPLWLAPVQAKILPVTDRALDHGRKLVEKFRTEGFRADLDERNEKLGAKIRDAQLEKIPYICVVGDREVESGLVAPRLRSGEQLGEISPEMLIQRMREELEKRRPFS